MRLPMETAPSSRPAATWALQVITEGSRMEKMEMADVGYLAVSLGYFKTLFSNSGKSTSSEVPEEIQREMGLSEGLVRFSVGLDDDIENTWQRIKACLVEAGII